MKQTATHRARRTDPPPRRGRLPVFAALLAAGLAGAARAEAADPVSPPALELERALVDVVKRVTPAFVFIGGGSGICISEDGWILTNYHVLIGPTGPGEKGQQWRVTFAGGKRLSADVVGFSLRGDLALLKVQDGKDLPHVALGDSDALVVGQHVFAVGNPFMLGARIWEPSVSFGIISALHRFQEGYSDAIQTDAQINPGNSGGPLFTMAGKVVGINGRIALKYGNRVNTGIGYAIPAAQIRRFLPKLKAGGRVYHGFIDGIQIANPDVAGGVYGTGVLVTGVYESEAGKDPTPAQKAGFEPGDLIVRVAGARTFNTRRFHGVLGTYPAGSTVTVTVKREDGEKDLTVYLGEAEGTDEEQQKTPRRPWLGLTGSRARGGEGLRVEDVTPGSPAEKAGLKTGDIILTADGAAVKTFRDLRDALGRKSPGEEMTLSIKRGDEMRDMPVMLGKIKGEEEGKKEEKKPEAKPSG